ncbi:DUF2127 domain-containing protein [Marinomonas sp. FW-1]|uniref:DUF2127 domain-containing protein n=1 Tax=Marinomonas sp. FW-1 TaxID=2071621 RepID=UPI0010BFB463|nr:DUF2127 domain-containing protein [Marinomonas sp. FW-1]
MKFEGLKAIAVVDGVKGLLALCLALSVNVIAKQDLHHLAAQLMQNWPISPNNYYVNLSLNFIEKLTQQDQVLVITVALMYSCFRFVIAYGLWHKLRWTEWFAFVSGSLYLPFELHAIYQNPSHVNFAILLFNLIVVAYLYWVLKRGEKALSIMTK